MGTKTCIFLFELLVNELPVVRSHPGPPVWNRLNAEKFRAKHIDSSLPGPFIINGRYETEVQREFRKPGELLKSPSLLQVGHGKHVRESLGAGWHVHEGKECHLPEFAPFIAGFFSRRSPLVRILQEKTILP
jgi:tRNA nucleotidyltransferase (CCA-adding enzyme)